MLLTCCVSIISSARHTGRGCDKVIVCRAKAEACVKKPVVKQASLDFLVNTFF
jgi:hypothetical protein